MLWLNLFILPFFLLVCLLLPLTTSFYLPTGPSSSSSSQNQGLSITEDYNVLVEDNCFSPAVLNVFKDETVRFTFVTRNKDASITEGSNCRSSSSINKELCKLSGNFKFTIFYCFLYLKPGECGVRNDILYLCIFDHMCWNESSYIK